MLPDQAQKPSYHHYLEGGGEMGQLIRDYDWSQTAIGSPDQWSQSLLTTISIIISSRFPMFLWWGSELIQFYNDAYRKSLGNEGKHPRALGQRGEDCWPEIWKTVQPMIDQAMTDGAATWCEDELLPIFRNNPLEDVYWTFSFSQVKDVPGQVGGVLVICTETTEKVQADRKIEKTLAEQDEIRKNDFIGMVSHELKTPLTSLNGYLQLMMLKSAEPNDPFIACCLNKANVQVKKMSTMINGFLNLSRLESGKIHLNMENFDLGQLIREMIEETNPTLQQHTISLHSFEAVTIHADRDKIGSVVSNLLSNAVKYSPKGKKIEVNCLVTDLAAQISIKDEGMGIKPSSLDRLFERFFRVETKHTANISGFGIGLYLCSEILEHHGGKIWVESEIGIGSTFHFSLPIKPIHAPTLKL